jgi:uncharacterized metal-binding protein
MAVMKKAVRKFSEARCARCLVPNAEKYCREDQGRGPADCPTLRHKEKAEKALADTPPLEMEFVRQASIQECAGYNRSGPANSTPAKPRIVEIVEFARRMNYEKLGLIFCGGLMKEGAIVQEILETNGFTVVSLMCKAGKVPKSAYGLTREQQLDVTKEAETICNPKFQALMANGAKVDFNILLGLCVGHDSLALKHLEAPTTVLAVKDRLLGHAPLAAVYMYDSYCQYLKKPLP